MRLETALERLEATAAGVLPQSESDRVAALEAQRDLLQLKHRRLLQNAERAVADLDVLLAGGR